MQADAREQHAKVIQGCEYIPQIATSDLTSTSCSHKARAVRKPKTGESRCTIDTGFRFEHRIHLVLKERLWRNVHRRYSVAFFQGKRREVSGQSVPGLLVGEVCYLS